MPAIERSSHHPETLAGQVNEEYDADERFMNLLGWKGRLGMTYEEDTPHFLLLWVGFNLLFGKDTGKDIWHLHGVHTQHTRWEAGFL